ncbi:MAG TPA: hypothetical protein VFL59_11780 [Candidatus Nanopelagicales bacterium]|nr:hypothetical protein [Candidatus Nanopelagicales bacterium]
MTRSLLASAACAALALSGCSATAAVTPSPSSTPSSSSPSVSTSVTSATPTPVDSATPDPTTPTPTPTHAATPDIVASGLVVRPATRTLRRGTFALGDSFLLGSKRVLTINHVRVDAVVGRQFYEGIPELRAVARTGTLPRNLVVHLGTNGTVTAKHCDTLVASAGPARRIFLVTVIGPRSWMAPNVRVLKACAARHRDQVVLVDWAALSAPHPNWFGPDHVHPNPTGRVRYNALILRALKDYGF